MQQRELDNSNSYVIKNAEGMFVGYLNLRRDVQATKEQVSALINKSKDLVIEKADEQSSDNPFAAF